MAARGGDERGNDSNEIVVHVPWISKRGCAGGHDSRDELVGLLERGLLDVEAVCCYPREGAVVEDNLELQYTTCQEGSM